MANKTKNRPAEEKAANLDGYAWRRKGLRTSFFVLIFATDDPAYLDEFLSEVHRITGHEALVMSSHGNDIHTTLEIGVLE